MMITNCVGEERGRGDSSQCNINSDVAVCFERCAWWWPRQTCSVSDAGARTGKYSHT